MSLGEIPYAFQRVLFRANDACFGAQKQTLPQMTLITLIYTDQKEMLLLQRSSRPVLTFQNGVSGAINFPENLEIPRCTRDFACRLPTSTTLRSRLQSGSN